MKKVYIIYILVIIGLIVLVRLWNGHKVEDEELAATEASKTELAAEVLAVVDSLADSYALQTQDVFNYGLLTAKEKKVKPDYLLDPSKTVDLVSKRQKINALGMLVGDFVIRKAYDMPTDKSVEAIARLASDVGYFLPMDNAQETPSNLVRREYEACKTNNEISAFWNFHYALMSELAYILASNPGLFFGKMTQDQCDAMINRTRNLDDAIAELAKIDEEMASVSQMLFAEREMLGNESFYPSVKDVSDYVVANKARFVERRNNLLK